MESSDDRDRKKSKRAASRSSKTKSKVSYIEDELETECSFGSLDSTESSDVHGEESSVAGDPCSSMALERSTPANVLLPQNRCAFCWRGEKSSLGQGILVKCEPTPGFNPLKRQLKSRQNSSEQLESNKRRGRGDHSKSPRRHEEKGKYAHVYNELSDVGLPEYITPTHVFDEPDRAVWAHHCCAAWCDCVLQAEDYSLQYVDKAAFTGMSQKCSWCRNYGATIPCKAQRCNKKYHYPCASATGCFQDIRSLTMLCPDHANQAENLSGPESHCVVCNEPGDMLRQLFCTSCGQHYHGHCLEPEIECNTVVRAGWQCPECKLCQECRKPGDDRKMLVCDVCDKGFHTFCLVPVMKTIPPNGWRCGNCRSCTDCGSKIPGTGPSSRWHINYTVCDSCYQHRNRGLICTVCKKAYKMNVLKGLTQCSVCRKYVHNNCDEVLQGSSGNDKYRCPTCLVALPLSPSTSFKALPAPDLPSADSDVTMEAAAEDSNHALEYESESDMGVDSEKMSVSSSSSRIRPTKPGKGKPASFARGKPSSKKPGKKLPSKGSKSGKIIKRRNRPPAMERRKARSKTKQAVATTHSSAPSAETINKAEDEHHSAVVLAAATDMFVLTQDMCMACGSYGQDSEGNLIVCTQCGQCYHPYCVSVKINSVIVTKGWRCLDCTVCEGCGEPTDEPLLLLCDECDISYHTYCLDPPLKYVPTGNWKCKWCVHCRYCGATKPGFGCEWLVNYTECGPCHSVTDCPVCDQVYMDNELVIQCTQCERWLHAECDNMKTEEDTERMSDKGYNCVFCRPETGAPSPQPPPVEEPPALLSPELAPVIEEEKTYMVDGVCLSMAGINLVKDVTVETPPVLTPAQKAVATAAANRLKNRPVKTQIRQSHPQMSQLLSSSGPTGTSAMVDDEGHPITEDGRPAPQDGDHENSQSAGQPQPAVEGQPCEGETGAQPGDPAGGGEVTEATKKKRTRRPMPLGIGGFIAKPRNRAPSKPVVQGPVTADGQPPLLFAELPTPDQEMTPADAAAAEAAKKKKRNPRKKGVIEDAYPAYLQEAFFGKPLVDLGKTMKTDEQLKPDDSKCAHKLIPSNCTINLSESTHLPPPAEQAMETEQPEPMETASAAAPEPMEPPVPEASTSAKEGTSAAVDEVPGIDGEDFKDILPGDILPGGIHEDELFKILALDDQPQDVTAAEAGPSDSKMSVSDRSAMPSTEGADVDMDKNLDQLDLDPKKLEDFLKGMLDTEEQHIPQGMAGDTPGGMPVMPMHPAGGPSTSVPMHGPPTSMHGPPAQNMPGPPQTMQGPPQTIQGPPLTMQAPQTIQAPGPSIPGAQGLHNPPQGIRGSSQGLQGTPHGMPPQNMQGPSANMQVQAPGSGNQYSMPPPSPYTQPPQHPPMSEFPQGMAPPQGAHTFNQSYPEASGSMWPSGASSAPPTNPEQEDETHMSFNKRNMLKWKDDEPLGLDATISPVLYANTNHPELKVQYPDWNERCKHIGKLWRKLTTDQRHPYLLAARENRKKQSSIARKAGQPVRRKPSAPKDSPLQSPRTPSHGNMSPARVPGPPPVDDDHANADKKTAEADGSLHKEERPGFNPAQAADPYSAPPRTPAVGSSSGENFSQPPGTPLNRPPMAAGTNMDPYARPPPTPGQPSMESNPTVTSHSQQASYDPYYRPVSTPRSDPYSQQPGTPFSVGPPPSTNRTPPYSAPSEVPPSSQGHTPAEMPITDSFPGPFTKRLTLLSQRIQSKDKQQQQCREQLLAGMGMNTDEVGKQHLRELLANRDKIPDQSWQDAQRMPYGPRPDYSLHRQAGPFPPRGWNPADGPMPRGMHPMGMGVRRPEGWPAGPRPPYMGARHPRPGMPAGAGHSSMESMFRMRIRFPPGSAQHRMQSMEGSRMPGVPRQMSLPAGHTEPPPYQGRPSSGPGRSPEQVARQQSHPGRTQKPSESEQEGLEDLLNTEGQFNLLEFAGSELDITLAEAHDKNMFDEHLGLKKDDAGNSAQASQSTDSAQTKTEQTPTSCAGSKDEQVESNPDDEKKQPEADLSKSVAPTVQPGTPVAVSRGTTPRPSPQALTGSPHPLSQPSSQVGSPHPNLAGGSPHTQQVGSHSNLTSGSPHPHMAASGSPHPSLTGSPAQHHPMGNMMEQRPLSRQGSMDQRPSSRPGSAMMMSAPSPGQQGFPGGMSPVPGIPRPHGMRMEHPAGSPGYGAPGGVYGPRGTAHPYMHAVPPSSFHYAYPLHSPQSKPRLLHGPHAGPPGGHPMSHGEMSGQRPQYPTYSQAPANPLHDLLEEEKRLQNKQFPDGGSKKPEGTMDTDGTLRDGRPPSMPPSHTGPPQNTPEHWQNAAGPEFQPPPPPYPGTGRTTPGVIRPNFGAKSPVMSPGLPPQSPGLGHAGMPQHGHPMMSMSGEMPPKDLQYLERLRNEEAELNTKLQHFEKEASTCRKKKKQLTNKQKQLKKNNEELSVVDAGQLELVNHECANYTKDIDLVKKNLKQNQTLVQDFLNKHQERMMQMGHIPGQGPRAMSTSHMMMRPRSGPPRMMDPRHQEMYQARMQMQMHANRPNMMQMGPRGPHPGYMGESGKPHDPMHIPQQYDPRYRGMDPHHLPPHSDTGGPPTDMSEDERRYMVQRSMGYPPMRGMHPDIAARYHQQHIHGPRFTADGGHMRPEFPPGATSRHPGAPAPRMPAPTTAQGGQQQQQNQQGQNSAESVKKKRQRRKRIPSVDEKPPAPAIHMGQVPLSFPGQELHPGPKPVVTTKPYTPGAHAGKPTELTEVPKEAMVSVGNQYPLKMVKAEPKDGKSTPASTSQTSDKPEERSGDKPDHPPTEDQSSVPLTVKEPLTATASPVIPETVPTVVNQDNPTIAPAPSIPSTVPMVTVVQNTEKMETSEIPSGGDETKPHPDNVTLPQPAEETGDPSEATAKGDHLLKTLLGHKKPSLLQNRNMPQDGTAFNPEQQQGPPSTPGAELQWTPDLGIAREQWDRIPPRDKQLIVEQRRNAMGQIGQQQMQSGIPPHMQHGLPRHPGPIPLHAMQNMQPGLQSPGARPPMLPGDLAAATPLKKKRAPQGQGAKKRQQKSQVSKPVPSSPAAAAMPIAANHPQSSPAPNEPSKLYEALNQSLRNMQPLNLQEPVLTAQLYKKPLQPLKPPQVPQQRPPPKPPVQPTLAGIYGDAVVEGQVDVYSYAPYTSVPLVINKPLPSGSTTPKKITEGGKPAKSSESSSDVYDISRFQKVISKSQVPEIMAPSPPLIAPKLQTAPSRMSASPSSVVSASSPDCDENKGKSDFSYPYLRPIKPENAAVEETRRCSTSPDIPLYAPVPIKGSNKIPRSSLLNTDESKMDVDMPKSVTPTEKDQSDVFSQMAEDELKSTAVGITSTLQSAIRESPSQQVSVTLTLSSEAAQDIPNVLSALADLLRMAAPPTSYTVETVEDEDKELMSILPNKPHFCHHCDVVIPAGQSVKKKKSELNYLTKDEQDMEKEDHVHFCSSSCAMQFMLSRQSNPPVDLSQKDVGNVMIEHKSLGGVTSPGSSKPSKSNSKKSRRRGSADAGGKPSKKWKGKRWRRWDIKVTFNLHKYDEPSEDDLLQILQKVDLIVKPNPLPEDTRMCILCQRTGDAVPTICARLINFDADKWVHLNCALWSTEVYETCNGALVNVEQAVKRGEQKECVVCHKHGATLGCFKPRCPNIYHINCAQKMKCMFFKDKTMFCPVHMPKESMEQLQTLLVPRKVYVNRDESQQIASSVLQDDKQCTVRIGAVVYKRIGQLFTHQISTGKFHTRDYIYPVGYKCVRFYWSMRYPNHRCCYECSILDGDGTPEFHIRVKETGHEDLTFKEATPGAVWMNILTVVEKQRREGNLVKIFPQFLCGEYLFGLKEPAIIRIIESLPGTELLANYAFKYGRTQLIEMPLAINPTGCARSEPKLRTHFRKPHTQQTSTKSHVLPSITVSLAGDVNSPYHKQFVHSKSQQYRRLKTEWRNYVYLGRSRIQGLGMYAARDIEKHTMVIEYIGEIIRNELAEYREKLYDQQNRGVYMFRITPDQVIDATMTGGPARYINHSCNPNCVAETVNIDKDVKIIIIANRRIAKGEELCYDYKFDLEDDSSKIPCGCGAANCRKWMN